MPRGRMATKIEPSTAAATNRLVTQENSARPPISRTIEGAIVAMM